ncbi:MAG: hypothetical protein O7A64_02995, partial [Alphaproteobacteria bacterium]|nr:hypothetical protein [Alphaproteobacteria bacterium]
MASIQRVKGRWFGRMIDPETGNRISVPIGESSEAAEAWKVSTTALEQAFRNGLRKHRKEADADASKQGIPTLQKALSAFMEALETRVQHATLRRYKDHDRCLQRLLPVSKPISAFGLADVDRFVKARLREGVDPRTISKEQAFLRRLVRFMHERWPEAVPRDWSGGSSLKPLPDGAGGEANRR